MSFRRRALSKPPVPPAGSVAPPSSGPARTLLLLTIVVVGLEIGVRPKRRFEQPGHGFDFTGGFRGWDRLVQVVQLRMQHGVLALEIPKSERAKPRRIAITQ